MAMRTVSFIRCKICNSQIDVYFGHGAIQAYACKNCYVRKRRLLSWLRNKLWWPKGLK